MSHLGDVDHAGEEGIMHPFMSGNEQGSPHRNRHQVNDFRGTGHSEAKQGQEEGRKRTDVDYEHDNWKHQNDLTLVRTQDPSPPDDDAVCDNILNQNSERWVSPQRMFADDGSEYGAGTL